MHKKTGNVHSKEKKESLVMNANAELLNFVYQNSQMGVDSLQQLLDIVKKEDFKEYLEKQLVGYEEFHKQAKEKLNANNLDEKGLNTFEKVRTYLMINVQTMMDKSTSHIAEMLITGSTMGIIDAVKKLHQYEGCIEPDIRKLMEDLLQFEQENVETLKKYL